jgi:internalin A
LWLGDLVWLEELSFASRWNRFDDSDNKWIYVKTQNIGEPNNLTTLWKFKTELAKLHKVNPFCNLYNLRKLFFDAQMDFDDLFPLSSLKNLQELSLFSSKVSDLSPLSSLTKLQALRVSNTKIVDLSPLSNLTNLRALRISNTQVNNLAPLSKLTNLQILRIFAGQIDDLTPLADLANIKLLDISNTLVTDLRPVHKIIENGLKVLHLRDSQAEYGLFVLNCPLTNPPVEIVRQGNAAILNYFNEQAIQGTDHLYEAKMLIIGEGGAGKTSLMRRLYQTETSLPNENETTKGIDIYRHEFKLDNGRNFRLNVWDFGGQEIYHATHQFFLTKRSLYILLDDTRKNDKTVHDASFKYWLEVADLLGDHSPVLIFQNEKGGRSKTIDISGIKAKFNNVKDVFWGNLEHQDAAEGLRKAIEFFAQNLPHIGEELPAKWIAIRADIEQQAKDKACISQDGYFDIYRKHLDFNKEKALHLSRYLHDLGVFLHFQDEELLKRTVILQNTWATEAVFKMLDDEKVKAKLGHFDKADCQRVWQDSAYADMHPELLALMQKFELCYRLPDINTDAWLAPQLLPPSKPTALTEWAKADDLTLRYRYEFLPKGIVSRLMVRMHRFVQRPELSWVSGALFERDGTELLVEVPAKGGEIVLRTRGSERKELLIVISADLDALNDSFHGLKDLVAKWVPCLCSRCRKLSEPEFFEQKRLLQRKKDGKLKVECPSSYEDVDVLELLDGIRVNQLPGWAKDESPESPHQVPVTKERTFKIFLASSSELKDDRNAFDLYFRQQNDRLRKQGIYLEIVRWENFLDAMSETRLQDEYNKEIKACDIFVSLFFTKTGKYTEEEFDVAHLQFLSANKPLIYTFFKNAPVDSGNIGDEINSLLDFKKKLAVLGHFSTSYDNIEHLKRQFKDQLEKLSG